MISTNSLPENIMWITRLLEILTRILDFFVLNFGPKIAALVSVRPRSVYCFEKFVNCSAFGI